MAYNLEERLTFLEESKHSHFAIAERLFRTTSVVDVFVAMTLKRSVSLVFGFVAMMRAKNYLCAAPLIRMQMDNLMRFSASFLAVDQQQFVVDLIGGLEVRKMKDKSGNRMTDAYLLKALSEKHTWLGEKYHAMSGYVHLSELHFYHSVRAKPEGLPGNIEVYIGPDDKLLQPVAYENAVEDMILVTHELLSGFVNWLGDPPRA